MKNAGRVTILSGTSGKGRIRRVSFLLLVLFSVAVVVASFFLAFPWIGKSFPGFLVNERRVIGNVGLYDWTGTEAGLRYPDKIVAAGATPLNAARDLQSVVERLPEGTPVTYVIERNGRIFPVTIPTMRFSLADFLTIYGTYLAAGIVFLVLALVVFLMKPDTRMSWAFVAATISLCVYFVAAFDVQTTYAGLVRLYIVMSVLFPLATVHLSLVFPEESGLVRRRAWVQWIPYGAATVLLVPMQILYPSPAYVKLSRIIPVLTGVATASLLLSTIVVYFRRATPISRQRAKVVLAGAVLAFPLPVLGYVLGSTFDRTIGNLQVLNNYLVFPVLIFPVSIAYAIARHNLFDVDVFIKRAVGYAIMTLVVGAAYLGLQVGLESVVLAPVFGSAARKITPVLFAFLVVFLFNPLNRRVQDVVDRMFYRKKFDYKATVTAVSEALSSVLNLDEIIRKIVGTVHSEMFIDRSGLVLAGAQGERLPAYFVGDDPSGGSEEIRSEILPANDPLVELVRKKKKLVTKYDVAEDPHLADVRETCGRRFEELGASLAVPLVYQGEVKAVLAVGHKKSGHFFTSEDIELLQTLASHGAVAIESANLAEQMKKDETVRTNLSRYLSPQIVDRIVQNNVQVNLGGDRKVVTVLFSDIRNFTTITESRPPDELITILNEYFTSMAETIFEQQGSLDKYIGDAIVAVFGSLIPLENPARKAVAAAVAMMNRLPELNRRWEERFGFSMDIGIGVNTGEVFLGNIGSPERMEFTVIGDAVNVASRFSGLAKAGQILVTRQTRVLLGADIPIREHPPAEVKGKSGKLEVFEVVYGQSVVSRS